MPLTIDWYNQIILITSPTTEVDMQTLADFIEDQMATPEGLNYPAIISPEGKIEDPSQPGVYSQIIILLNSPWQIQFWGGSGYTRIYGGKLVGGLNDQPIKATGTANDITVLQSPVDGITIDSATLQKIYALLANSRIDQITRDGVTGFVTGSRKRGYSDPAKVGTDEKVLVTVAQSVGYDGNNKIDEQENVEQ